MKYIKVTWCATCRIKNSCREIRKLSQKEKTELFHNMPETKGPILPTCPLPDLPDLKEKDNEI